MMVLHCQLVQIAGMVSEGHSHQFGAGVVGRTQGCTRLGHLFHFRGFDMKCSVKALLCLSYALGHLSGQTEPQALKS